MARVLRPKITLLSLIAVAAVLAVGYASFMAWTRHQETLDLAKGYQARARRFAGMAAQRLDNAAHCDRLTEEKQEDPESHPGWTLEALAARGTFERKTGEYYRTLEAKYHQAAKSPQLPVEPDPQPPR